MVADRGWFLPTNLPGPADLLALNARGTLLAAGCSEQANEAVVLETASGREVARVSELWLTDYHTFAFIGDKLLGLWQGQVACFDPATGAYETLWADDRVEPHHASVSPDGRLLAIGISGGLLFYNLQNRECRRLQSDFFESRCYRATFSPGGRYLAAALHDGNFSVDDAFSFTMIWDTQGGRRWRTFFGGSYREALAFRGDTLTVAMGENQIHLYEPDQGENPVTTYYVSGMARALQFLGDGSTLAVAGYRTGLTILETSTGKVLREMGPPGNREIWECQPNADWSVMAGAADGGVVMWETGLP